jgi:hypothetical protein
MSSTINARLPLRLEQKLAEYCAKRGVKRSEAVVRALDHFLERESGGADAYSLIADLIPKEGVKSLQADSVRDLAGKAFRGTRTR